MDSAGGASSGGGPAGESGRGADSAQAVLRILPDYRTRPAGDDKRLVELVVEAELVSFTAGEGISADTLAALKAELAATLERINRDVPRLLSDEETARFRRDGRLVLPLADFRGESVFSRHALFDKPAAFLTLRPYPEVKLRFVNLDENGRARLLRNITPYRPFRVEAIYFARPERTPDKVEVSAAGRRLRVALWPVEGQPMVWRSDEILPLPDPDRAAPPKSAEAPSQPEPQEPEPQEDEVAESPDYPGLDTPLQPDSGGDESAAPEPSGDTRENGETGETAGSRPPTGTDPVLLPGPTAPPADPADPWRYIIPYTPVVTPSVPLDEIDLASPLSAPAGDTGSRQGSGSAQPPTTSAPTLRRGGGDRQPPSGGETGRIIAGIEDGVRIVPGRNSRAPVRSLAQPPTARSPLLQLVDRLGLEDPRVQALMSDGIQPEDETKAQAVLDSLDSGPDPAEGESP